MKKLLVIGRTFPEPSTTAAGGRMIDLLQFFLDQKYEVIFASAAGVSMHSASLDTLGIKTQSILINNESFDELLRSFQADVVLFDRFVTEEQYGWRVQDCLPKALKILDTEDLHFLRKARQNAHQDQVDFKEEMLYSDEAKRELASILRCDVSLIISQYEMELLTNKFKIPQDLLHYLPLLVEATNRNQGQFTFEERHDFVSVGNFYHAPNLEAVIRLKREIWPLIRKVLPQAKLHIYGAYAPLQVLEMHKPKDGFFIEGWVEDLDEVLSNARVCLAPISFGAGLKGKLLQAMMNGTPVVTTDIGAEAMYTNYRVPGIIANENESFAQAAVALYTEDETWQNCLKNVDDILSQQFSRKRYLTTFSQRLNQLAGNLETHRQSHFITQIIQYHTLQSTKYMSKWISEKNRIKL